MYMMMNMIILNLILMFIPFLILILNKFISMIKSKNREKMLPFECGFDPLTNSRLPFSIKFFLITLIFLIFDLEIILLIPSIFIIKFFYTKWVLITMMIFMMFLIFSLLMEWFMNYLKWIN